MKKISTLGKFLIFTAITAAGIGATFGGIAIYNKVAEKYPNNHRTIIVENFENLTPISFFVNPITEEPLALLSADGESVKTINSSWNHKDLFADIKTEARTFDSFKEWYIKQFNGETPIQHTDAGRIKFVNEYVEAVSPLEFHKYVDWFVKNVSWGPEIATLDRFKISKNVIINGSNVTLGAHSNEQREESLITFYPDSFYGSLPLYSTTTGQHNAISKLLYQLNLEFLNTSDLNNFLSTTSLVNARANYQFKANTSEADNFRNLPFAGLLKGLDVYVYKLIDSPIPTKNNNLILKSTTLLEAIEEVKAFDPTIEFNEKFLVKANIANISTRGVPTIFSEGEETLSIGFDLNSSLQFLDIAITDYDKLSLYNLESLEILQNKNIVDKFVNFRDWANIKQYEGKTLFIYNDESHDRVFVSKDEASNVLFTKYDETKILQYTITSLSVENAILKIVLADDKNVEKIINISANTENLNDLNFLDDLHQAVGYKKILSPFMISSVAERRVNGVSVTDYNIFSEIYNGLLDKVLRKFPYLLKDLEGEHIVREVDKNGEFKYRVENGKYKGFATTDRIPFILILKTIDPDFKGVGTDFLRYVGTHEYGHHITLQSAQDSGEANTAILGGISSRQGLQTNQFYDNTFLNLYLQARSSKLDFDVKNITKTNVGNYPIFSWKDEKGETILEGDDLIFGSSKTGEASLPDVLANPQRRFLQTFDGLKEAARLRGLKIYDLFLLNSIDYFTGTLNPFIRGTAKYFKYEKQIDENGVEFSKPSFVDASVANAATFLKDGVGNPITFIDGLPQIVKTRIEKVEVVNQQGVKSTVDKTIFEVLVFDKENRPVIIIDPEKGITESQEQQISSIQNTILNLIEVNYSNNGWNNARTEFTFEPTFTVTNESFNQYITKSADYFKKYIENRFLPIELTKFQAINTASNFFSGENKDTREIGKFANIATNLKDVYKDLSFKGTNYYFYNNFLNYETNGAPLSWSLADSVIRFAKYDNNNVDLNAVSYIANPYLGFNAGRDQRRDLYNRRNVESLLFGLIPNDLLSEFRIIINPNITSNQAIKNLYLNLFEYKSEQAVVNNSNVSNLLSIKVKRNNLQGVNQAFIEKEFLEASELIEFLSLDYSKFSIDNEIVNEKDVRVRNWNIEYAKTKFDFSKILPESGKPELSEQQKANIAMEAFYDSAYNMFIKNNNLGKDWSFISNVLDPQFGNEYLKNDYFVQGVSNKGKFEFNSLDLMNAFKKLLTKNNLTLTDEQLQKLDTQDIMIFLGYLTTSSSPSFTNSDGLNNIFSRINFLNKPSNDIITYNNERTNADISQIFTDYVYNIAESLTRDFVQTTYAPGRDDLSNLPEYLSGVSESTTGLEYFLDPRAKELVWNSRVVIDEPNRNGVSIFANNIAIFQRLNFAKHGDVLRSMPQFIESTNSSLSREIEKEGLSIYKNYLKNYDDIINNFATNNSESIAKMNNLVNQIIQIRTDNYEIVASKEEKEALITLLINSLGLETFLLEPTTTNQAIKDGTIKFYQDIIDAQKTILETRFATLSQSIISETKIISKISFDRNNLLKKLLDETKVDPVTKKDNALALNSYIDSLLESISDLTKRSTKLNVSSQFNFSPGNLAIFNPFFTRANKLNNGFFKDRFQKEVIDWELYDDSGKPIVDPNIRIKELDGVNNVTDRARAFWIFLLRSYGIGDRTVSGILRNKEKDTNFFWGYVKKELGEKISHLAFQNTTTGETKYLNINVKNTNNLFYYKEQADESKRVTLADEGYSSWITDSATFAKYNDAFLIPDGIFKVFFVDKDKKELEGLSLGSRVNIGENGKGSIQSPTRLEKQADGTILFYLLDQFNL